MTSARQAMGRLRAPLAVACVLALLALAPPTRVMGTSALGLAWFYGIVLAVAASSPVADAWHVIGTRAKVAVGVGALVTCAFVAWYLSLYDFIPYWDTLQYWTSTLQFNVRLDERPYRTVLDALASVNTSDYNDMQCWVMSLPVRMLPGWGQTFFAEFALVSVPLALVGSLACVGMASSAGGWSSRRPFAEEGENTRLDALFVALFAVWLLSPVMLRPVLSGYLDEPGALLFVAACALAFDPRLPRRPLAGIPLGLALCAMLVLRRWYAYGVLGLVCASVLWWGVRIAGTPRGGRREAFVGVARVFVVVFASAVVPLVALFSGLVTRSLGGNYAEAYASWTWASSLSQRVADVYARVGPIWVFVAAAAILVALRAAVRAPRASSALHDARPAHFPAGTALPPSVADDARREMLLRVAAPLCLMAGAAASVLVFWRIQDFSPQHWYLFVPLLLFALGASVSEALLWGRSSSARPLCAAAVALALITCVNGLGLAGAATTVLSRVTGIPATAPIVQEGVAERRELVAHLKESVGEGESVYFACASAELNHSTVIGCVAPDEVYNPFACEYADVDSRDGFNTAFFDAEWVVATTPYQIHLNDPDDERVVTTLNDLVQDGRSVVGRHYELVRDVDLHMGIVAHIYRRTSDYERADVECLRDLLCGMYPQWPELFRDRFETYLAAMRKPTS